MEPVNEVKDTASSTADTLKVTAETTAATLKVTAETTAATLKERASGVAEERKVVAVDTAAKLIQAELIIAEARKTTAEGIADKLRKTASIAADALVVTAKNVAKIQLRLLVDNSMFRAIFDSIGDGVIVATQEGDVQFSNVAATAIIGELGKVPPNEFTTYYHFYKPDKTTPWTPGQDPLARALRGYTTIGELMWVARVDKPGTFVSCMSVPLTYKGEDVIVVGGLLIFRELRLMSDQY